MNRRERTLAAVDAMKERIGGCDFVSLVDRETGLVLSKDSASRISQRQLDALASEASVLADGSHVSALRALADSATHAFVLQFRGSRATVTVASLETEDTVICRIDGMPDRESVIDSARGVISAANETEVSRP